MLRIGWVSSINAFPFHLPFKKDTEDFLFSYAAPTHLNHMLKEGELDVALTSSVEYLDQRYLLLPGFGIAANSCIRSVNLYTKRSPHLLDGARIGLTSQSATSVALLKVLCHHVWKVNPRFELLDRTLSFDAYDGVLLIGDEALQYKTLPHFQTIDLASVWYEATHYPFVFAVFSVKETSDPVALRSFEKSLPEALAWSETHAEHVIEAAEQKSGLPPALIREYFQTCQYRIGHQEWEGLKLFNSMRQDVKDHSPLYTIDSGNNSSDVCNYCRTV